jgi:hypothetical protein
MFGGGGGIGGGPPYKPTEIREAANSPPMQYLHVCAMDAYKHHPVEFLRWTEYKKGPQPQAHSSPGLGSFGTGTTFGQQPATSTPSFSFGNTNTGTTFGQTTSCMLPSSLCLFPFLLEYSLNFLVRTFFLSLCSCFLS